MDEIDHWRTGSRKTEFLGKNVYLFWQGSFPTSRVNPTYLNSRLSELTNPVEKIDNPVFIFQFGSVDLQTRITSIFEINEIVLKYIVQCLKFSKEHGAIAFFVSPISHNSLVKPDISNYFVNSLSETIDQCGLKKLIDLQEVFGTDFTPESWDIYCHLNIADSKKALEYILTSIE
jgi:hypothetical protein